MHGSELIQVATYESFISVRVSKDPGTDMTLVIPVGEDGAVMRISVKVEKPAEKPAVKSR